MPKPRVFIGSSVEGLNVAYAVQQNLLHDAEVTVWDQGVFELSRTTIESLTNALAENDFGVFVFSPDDLTRIRDTTTPSVRDNVLFEFGLFIGRLGRERVFFLLPSNGDLHLPTDLLGVTPGRYEPNRTDGSMQAATGPVCHQIRQQIKSLGLAPGRVAPEASAETESSKEEKGGFWLQDIVDKKYDKAKAQLESELRNLTGDDALATQAWIIYCDFKNNDNGGIENLVGFAKENSNSSRLLSVVAMILRWEGYVTKAIELLSEIQLQRPKDASISTALAYSHRDGADMASAINELQRVGPDDFPNVAIDLANFLENENQLSEALKVVQRCHAKHPSDKDLRYKYARLAQELNKHEVAANLLQQLTIEDPESIEYWGYLGNSCLQLDLHDIALNAYKCAQKLMKEDQSSQWITFNIGNLFTNLGLPTEGREYLQRGLKYESESEYAHDRLAGALRKKADEQKEFQKKCEEGRRQMREAEAEVFAPAAVQSNAFRGLLADLQMLNN